MQRPRALHRAEVGWDWGAECRDLFRKLRPYTATSGGVAIPAGGIHIAYSAAADATFVIYDVNGNVLPGGTTVALSTSGAGLTVAAPTSFAIPCTSITRNTPFGGITLFPFTITASTTGGTGVATLTVTTPKGLVTIYQFDVTVP